MRQFGYASMHPYMLISLSDTLTDDELLFYFMVFNDFSVIPIPDTHYFGTQLLKNAGFPL